MININLYLLICVFSSGIKYIIISLILTTFFLFGILLTIILSFGWPLIIVFLLKLGIFPFHKLTADLYDGLPTDIMMLIQLPLKFGIFIFLIRNLNYIIYSEIIILAIIIPAISTQYAITFKRFISLSSTSYQTLLFLLLGYNSINITNYVIVYFITLNILMLTLDSLSVILLFLSIAGLPPFIGFYFKLYLLSSIIDQGLFWLLIIFLSSSLILTANYLERSKLLNILAPNLKIQYSFIIGILLFWSCFAI